MGRSQVLRNQRLGGRSGRGRTNSSTSQSKTNRGHRSQPRDASSSQQRNTNSSQGWRHFPNNDVDVHTGSDDETKFMSTASSSAPQDLDEKFLALEAHGNYASYHTSHEDDQYMHVTITTKAATGSLNIQKINRGLSALTLHELLGLPPHLTESLENTSSAAAARRHGAADDDDSDVLRIERSLDDCKVVDIQSPSRDATQAVVSRVITEESKTVTLPLSESNVVEDNMDDDDMESWLDSVIS